MTLTNIHCNQIYFFIQNFYDKYFESTLGQFKLKSVGSKFMNKKINQKTKFNLFFEKKINVARFFCRKTKCNTLDTFVTYLVLLQH